MTFATQFIEDADQLMHLLNKQLSGMVKHIQTP